MLCVLRGGDMKFPRLHIQTRSLGGLYDKAGMQALFHGQMGPLVGVYNHFFFSKIAGCVSWQGGTTCWIPWLGRAIGYTPKSTCLGGVSSCALLLSGWLKSVFIEGHRQDIAVGQELRLCPEIRQNYRLYHKVEWDYKVRFIIRCFWLFWIADNVTQHSRWLGGTSHCILQLCGPRDCAPWLDGVAVLVFSWGMATVYAQKLGRVTYWTPFLEKTTGSVQLLGRAVGYTLKIFF